MPTAANETMNHIHEPTEDESFERINEEQIILEDDMEINSNDSDTWSNNDGLSEYEHESDNIFSDNDEINSSPSPTMETASSSVPEEPQVMHTEFLNITAGRNRSRNVARRGRRSPHPRNMFPMYVGTPIESDLTFNGFAKNLELEEILECTVDSFNTLLFLVKWRNDGNKVRKIEASLLRTHCPQKLMDFYEEKTIEYIVNNTPDLVY